MATMLLDDLAQRISQQEAQLQALRRELDTRQRQLADLSQQKQRLLTQLQQIDAQIAGIAGSSPSVKTSQSKTGPAKPNRAVVLGGLSDNGFSAKPGQGKAPAKRPAAKAKASKAAPAGQPSLPGLIVTLLREAGRPLTVTQLAEGAKRRGFTTSSPHYLQMVAVRSRELKEKGVLQKAVGQPGFVLAQGMAATAYVAGQRTKPERAGFAPGSLDADSQQERQAAKKA